MSVAPERVIRTIAGLRPFRPSGFVVRAEKADDKTIVHNYGHGGAGITLSWGTAHLAALEVQKTGQRESRRSGIRAQWELATTRLLVERGFKVSVYTKDLPPNTTSNIAGGQWFPFTVYDVDCLTPGIRGAVRHRHRVCLQTLPDHGGRLLRRPLDAEFPDSRHPAADQRPDEPHRAAVPHAAGFHGAWPNQASISVSICAAIRHHVHSASDLPGGDAARVAHFRCSGGSSRVP